MQLSQRVLALPAVQQIMAQTKSSLGIKARGQLVRVVGLTLEAQGCRVAIGDHCLVGNPGQQIETEVIGFSGLSIYLMPITSVSNLSQLEPGAMVVPSAGSNQICVGDGYLGRVIGGDGSALDSLPLPDPQAKIPLQRPPINPLQRQPIKHSLDVGVRSINALLSVGQGQRMGLFAGSGVGKSVLLGMMTRFTDADVCVVALVGERGREVKEFIDDILGPAGMAKAVVIASPADDAPLVRLRAALRATAFAEYFRDQGKKVLLLMDSLTRFAQAQREIALSSGEPPASKGYPPSVFSKLPALVERAGNGDGQSQGSITAFYTVLTEGDDQQDPIADAARAILDGHVVLSRSLAEAGHYPAVDVEASISRAMPAVVKESHLLNSQRFKQLYAHYQQNLDLINVGAYSAGNDADLDFAIAHMPTMKAFLQQGLFDQANFVGSRDLLAKCISASVKPATS